MTVTRTRQRTEVTDTDVYWLLCSSRVSLSVVEIAEWFDISQLQAFCHVDHLLRDGLASIDRSASTPRCVCYEAKEVEVSGK